MYEFFQFFFTYMKILFLKKNRGYKRRIVSSITQKILLCNVESCYENISEIRKVIRSFQNFQKREIKIEKNVYGFWKFIEFIENEEKKRLPDRTIFFTNFLITFQHFYYAK